MKTIGRTISVALIVSKSNESIANELLSNVTLELTASGINSHNIKIFKVPGCLEIPRIARIVSERDMFNIVICLGIVIKFGSPMFEFLGNSIYQGMLNITTFSKIPVLNGIIMAENPEEAEKLAKLYGKKLCDATLEALDIEEELKK